MREGVHAQSEPIHGRFRLSDPIQVNAEILHGALQIYEDKLGFMKLSFGMASETMKQLSSLCKRLKKNQKNSLHSRYLQPEELFELANILFEKKQDRMI